MWDDEENYIGDQADAQNDDHEEGEQDIDDKISLDENSKMKAS